MQKIFQWISDRIWLMIKSPIGVLYPYSESHEKAARLLLKDEFYLSRENLTLSRYYNVITNGKESYGYWVCNGIYAYASSIVKYPPPRKDSNLPKFVYNNVGKKSMVNDDHRGRPSLNTIRKLYAKYGLEVSDVSFDFSYTPYSDS